MSNEKQIKGKAVVWGNPNISDLVAGVSVVKGEAIVVKHFDDATTYNPDTFDRMTAQGYKLNLLTGEYYRP